MPNGVMPWTLNRFAQAVALQVLLENEKANGVTVGASRLELPSM